MRFVLSRRLPWSCVRETVANQSFPGPYQRYIGSQTASSIGIFKAEEQNNEDVRLLEVLKLHQKKGVHRTRVRSIALVQVYTAQGV